MADSNVVLKISFEDQLRRTQLAQPLTIVQVREQISRLFPNVKYFNLSYLDEEGDKITVSSDIELQEAHRVCHPNIRLTLEKLDQPSHSSFSAEPPAAGSLLDHVSPSLNSTPASAAPPSIATLFPPVGSLLNYLSPGVSGEEDVELQKQLEAIYMQEKEEKEEKERIAREENERRERAEQRERERLEREKAEREEKERLERERAERERLERERIEREERERQAKLEFERQEREAREILEKLELEKKMNEERERLEKERMLLDEQRNSREQDREKILESNEMCGEILERLLSEGVELELVWQALEYSNYSNEKRARDLLKMNELGLDFRKASDALTRFHGNVDEAIDSLLG